MEQCLILYDKHDVCKQASSFHTSFVQVSLFVHTAAAGRVRQARLTSPSPRLPPQPLTRLEWLWRLAKGAVAFDLLLVLLCSVCAALV